MDFSGKIVLVTGGSRGIGKATAIGFASFGADVAVIYAGNQAKAEETAEEIRKMGRRAEIYKCNVASFDEVKATVEKINTDLGKIDILVNNAGITRDGLAMSIKDKDWDDVINTNLKGAFNLIKACYSGFIRKRSGKIVNISSVSGIMGNAGQANYSASKAGIIGLTKSIARELAGRNINCNAVAPGFVATDMTEAIKDDNSLLQMVPKKRMGKPSDIANAVMFLASDEADYITGTVLRVDGGLSM
jgi:3-oxoacyl-[acyl-carrier protein] reductase